MKILFTFVIISSILLTSCSHSGWKDLPVNKTSVQVYKQVPSDFIPRNLTIVCAGDSLTQGVGDSSQKGGYLPYLQKMFEKDKGINNVKFYNYGVKGNVTTQLIKRLRTTELMDKVKSADMVIITIGGNDIMKVVQDNISNLQVSAFMKEKEIYISHLTQIIDTINQENPQATIVLVGIYNPFEKWFSNITELNRIVKDWNNASQMVIDNYPNAYFVDIEDLFMNSKQNLLYTDNFHPNDKGYELIAERLHDSLEKQALPNMEKKAYIVSNEEKLTK